MTSGNKFNKSKLGLIGVLVLVHEYERELFPIASKKVFVLFEQFHWLHEEIIEVKGALLL